MKDKKFSEEFYKVSECIDFLKKAKKVLPRELSSDLHDKINYAVGKASALLRMIGERDEENILNEEDK